MNYRHRQFKQPWKVLEWHVKEGDWFATVFFPAMLSYETLEPLKKIKKRLCLLLPTLKVCNARSRRRLEYRTNPWWTFSIHVRSRVVKKKKDGVSFSKKTLLLKNEKISLSIWLKIFSKGCKMKIVMMIANLRWETARQ